MTQCIAGALSARVPAEFRALLDEVEPWLSSQPMRKWSDYVVYATDAEPEFKRGAVGSRFHCTVVPKSQAILDEEGYGTECGRALVELFRKEQGVNVLCGSC